MSSFNEKLPAYTSEPFTPPTFVRPKANKICCITLRDTDRILLINAPMQVIRSIRLSILESWYKPIQSEGEYYGGYEFKVKGNPWRGFCAETVHSRKLVLGILRRMAFLGWKLIQASDVTKSRCEMDSLFFEFIGERSDEEEGDDVEGMEDVDGERREIKLEADQDTGVEMFALSFEWWDRLRVIEGSPENIAAIKDALQTVWTKGIQLEKDYAGSYEFKLGGSPFNPWKWDSIEARMMFIQILANLKSQGFSLYASIDISPKQQDEKIESWFFKRDKVKDEGTASRARQHAYGGDDKKTGLLVDF
ncbi:hypothetical protein BGZ97_003924 [Linnemannia gamsii]|uniref:Uncharacterized protein n=1 Tax=Linnemannia gamsii TaxID=64522 RepID=A0A9P6QSI2_9FUNG|nr:hypothetical protein BGZ97_003924 [Linnemannia gamsii]